MRRRILSTARPAGPGTAGLCPIRPGAGPVPAKPGALRLGAGAGAAAMSHALYVLNPKRPRSGGAAAPKWSGGECAAQGVVSDHRPDTAGPGSGPGVRGPCKGPRTTTAPRDTAPATRRAAGRPIVSSPSVRLGPGHESLLARGPGGGRGAHTRIGTAGSQAGDNRAIRRRGPESGSRRPGRAGTRLRPQNSAQKSGLPDFREGLLCVSGSAAQARLSHSCRPGHGGLKLKRAIDLPSAAPAAGGRH